jgi:hypothetical protein
MKINNINVIGIDLSLKSTGITVYDTKNNKLIFGNIISNKISDKHRFKNINYIKYSDKPLNFKYHKTINNGEYSEYEGNQSLKIMMAVKSIMRFLSVYLKNDSNRHNVIVFESHLLPQILGIKQFRGLSHLIALQHILRENIILHCLKENISIEFCFFSPSEVKSLFTGNGRADKSKMVDIFIDEYDGKKLIPDILRDKEETIMYLNDIVDSFALVTSYFNRLYNIVEKKIPVKTKITKRKKTEIKSTFKDSLINSIIN